MMQNFAQPNTQKQLQRLGLNRFEALWQAPLQPVDEPNYQSRANGKSQVFKLTAQNQSYYVKKQINYFGPINTLHPFKLACEIEFKNILHFQKLNLTQLQVAYFSLKKAHKSRRAILMTYALDGWSDLASYYQRWHKLRLETRKQLVTSSALLIQKLHRAKLFHGSCQAKHIFLRPQGSELAASFIDLEGARPRYFGLKDIVRDIERFYRHSKLLSWDEKLFFLKAYMPDKAQRQKLADNVKKRIMKRQEKKADH